MHGICEYVNELVVFFSLRIQTDVKNIWPQGGHRRLGENQLSH